jgi:pyruvate,water dikinase
VSLQANAAANPLHGRSAADASWSTLNVGEAMPGVATPLSWGIWSQVEHAPRAAFHALGTLPRAQLAIPAREEDRILNLFYGRLALRVDFLLEMADLIPGSTGENLARDIFGFVPPGYVSRPSKRRWPIVAMKLPTTFALTPRMVRRTRFATQTWWREAIAEAPALELDGARRLYRVAAERFRVTQSVSATAVTCAIQPVFEAVTKLAASVGVDAAPLMQGHGSHEETAMIGELWAVSRGRLTLDAFLARCGYHGPDEGELSARVWRENPAPLWPIIEGYRALGDDADPVLRARARARERERAEADLLRALPAGRRPGARLLLALAGRYLPLRAVAKIAFVQSIDVARAAARQAGRRLADDGLIDEPDDVFYATADELADTPSPEALRTAIAERRALRARFQQLELPTSWTGFPEATPIEPVSEPGAELQGVGVSPGVAEGVVRVVTDPTNTEMNPGDILVASTTDPSWASVMFLSGALVVDIGSQLSHAAVVAREIGVPCVVNTRVGTRVLETGDRCRVDGTAGTVVLLARAQART